MLNNNLTVTKDVQNKEITLERIVNGSRALVWKGWTEPEHIARWWGPEGWTAQIEKMDVRPGGIWHYSMQPVDGSEKVWGLISYQEVVKPSHLKYMEAASNAAGDIDESKQSEVTVEFAEVDQATTKIIIKTKFKSLADLETMERMGMAAGYNGALNKLEKYIENN
ncbi:SRPBCC domain-containing protein [Candidatus Roizmanbacteria bacterium]|nr:SRPBCC domain-containing protein [Candidatus Roizmanbacteria bacterium]